MVAFFSEIMRDSRSNEAGGAHQHLRGERREERGERREEGGERCRGFSGFLGNSAFDGVVFGMLLQERGGDGKLRFPTGVVR